MTRDSTMRASSRLYSRRRDENAKESCPGLLRSCARSERAVRVDFGSALLASRQLGAHFGRGGSYGLEIVSAPARNAAHHRKQRSSDLVSRSAANAHRISQRLASADEEAHLGADSPKTKLGSSSASSTSSVRVSASFRIAFAVWPLAFAFLLLSASGSPSMMRLEVPPTSSADCRLAALSEHQNRDGKTRICEKTSRLGIRRRLLHSNVSLNLSAVCSESRAASHHINRSTASTCRSSVERTFWRRVAGRIRFEEMRAVMRFGTREC